MPPFLPGSVPGVRHRGIGHRHIPRYAGDAVQFRAELAEDSTHHGDTRDTWRQVIEGTLTEVWCRASTMKSSGNPMPRPWDRNSAAP